MTVTFGAKNGTFTGTPKMRIEEEVTLPEGWEELLHCSVCIGPLSNPITIPCGHSFCAPCLKHIHPQRCPLCRTPFPSQVKPSTVLSSICTLVYPNQPCTPIFEDLSDRSYEKQIKEAESNWDQLVLGEVDF